MNTHFIRYILRSIGIEAYRRKNLPFGLDLGSDMKRQLPIAPKVIFDIGANIGQTTKFFMSTFPRSEIYAFEPVKDTFEHLTHNVSKDKIHCYQLAVGDEPGEDIMVLQQKSGLNSLVKALNQSVGESISTSKVQITTLDLFCQNHDVQFIDVVKIDTEGYGLRILEGGREMLSKNVGSVLIEVGFSEGDLRHDQFALVNQYLHDYGFELFGFYDQWINGRKLIYCNAFFVKREYFNN